MAPYLVPLEAGKITQTACYKAKAGKHPSSQASKTLVLIAHVG